VRNTVPPTDAGDQEDAVQTDPETDNQEQGGRHHAKEGADRHPLIDLERDPTPGVADHAAPDEEE
jgi:hypothetical protein